MLKPGEYVAKYLRPHDGGELDPEQIQPNGVDLTIDRVMSHRGIAYIGDDEYAKPIRKEAEKFRNDLSEDENINVIDSDEVYYLPPGGYVIVYNEEIIEIPEDHVGFVWPRSRFLRVSSHLTSAVWDTGYSGRGEGALITTQPMYIGTDIRVGQMTFTRAQTYQSYEGQHDGERIDE